MKNFQQKAVESDQQRQEATQVPVTDYMVKELITFKPEMGIMKVIETLLENKISGGPVLNDKKELVGMIDDKDCLKVLFDSTYHNQPMNNHTVAHYMSNVMKTISVHANIYEVADAFVHTKYKRLLVVDDKGRLVGQISRRDILRAINDSNTHAR